MKSLLKVTASNGSNSVEFFAYEGDDYSRHLSYGYAVTGTASTAYTHAPFAQEVAAHLLGEWAIEPTDARPDCDFRLVRADGLRLWLAPRAAYNRPGKGSATYDRPRDRKGCWVNVYGPGGSSDPSINFALTKTPEQVAKDITRRLLPDAESVHARVLAQIASANAYADKAEVAKAVTAALPSNPHGVYFSANGDKIEVRGYITPEVAKKVAALLASIPATE